MMTRTKRIVFASIATLLALAVLEIACRLLPWPERPTLSELAFAQADSPQLYLDDPELAWKLRPSLELSFAGIPLRTSSLGLRGAEPVAPVVLCLGDSVSFGYFVSEAESFPARLSRRLGVETLAAAVPGYSSRQGRVLLSRLLETFSPRVVVISFGYNDGVRFPLGDRREASGVGFRLASALGRSALARRLGDWFGEGRRLRRAREVLEIRARDLTQFPPKDALEARRFAQGEARIRELLAEAPERVPLEEYRDNLRAMVRAARERGALPVLLAPPFASASMQPYFAASLRGQPVDAYRRIMIEVAREEGCALVRVPPLEESPADPDRRLFVTRELSPAEREGFRLLAPDAAERARLGLDPTFRVRTDLAHPSAEGHALIAAALADLLAPRGFGPAPR